MSYWLPHIAVDVDQLLRFLLLLLTLLYCCYALLLLLCARATLALFFKLTKTKCCLMQFAAVRASAQAHMIVCVCVSIVYLGNATCLTYIFMLYVSQYSCANESVLLLFALPTHSLTYCTHMHIHVCMCVCLICIQSEFQLTFEFCTFCNAYVMLTAAERTLSITMRALSFLSLSLCIVVQCR